MGLWLAFFTLASLAGLVLGLAAYLAGRAKNASEKAFQRQLASLQARWEAMAASNLGGNGAAGGAFPSPGPGGANTLVESFTLGWLNLLVNSLWVPVLEKYVASIAAERLQILLNELLTKNKHKSPWQYIESVAVEEVTFGLVPPRFQFCLAKYDPSRSYLSLAMDMRFVSSGFQAMLSPRLRPIEALPPFGLKLEVSYLAISGRLNLGLMLTKEAPGISKVEYSFASPPEFDLHAVPVGAPSLATAEIPTLLLKSLRAQIVKAMTRKVVEPNRRAVDVQKIYRNKHLAKIGGPGGVLRVLVVGARNLLPASGKPSASASGNNLSSSQNPSNHSGKAQAVGGGGSSSSTGAGKSAGDAAADTGVDAFLEMRYGREVFRTPIVHHNATNPVWNWQFELKLPADLPLPRSPATPATSSAQGGQAAGMGSTAGVGEQDGGTSSKGGAAGMLDAAAGSNSFSSYTTNTSTTSSFGSKLGNVGHVRARTTSGSTGTSGAVGSSTTATPSPSYGGAAGAGQPTGAPSATPAPPRPPGPSAPETLRFSILNAMTVGEPEVMCHCVVHIASLGLTPNGPAVPLMLPLLPSGGSRHQPRASTGSAGGAPGTTPPVGSLQVMLEWGKSVSKKDPWAPVGSKPTATAAPTPATPATAGATAGGAPARSTTGGGAAAASVPPPLHKPEVPPSRLGLYSEGVSDPQQMASLATHSRHSSTASTGGSSHHHLLGGSGRHHSGSLWQSGHSTSASMGAGNGPASGAAAVSGEVPPLKHTARRPPLHTAHGPLWPFPRASKDSHPAGAPVPAGAVTPQKAAATAAAAAAAGAAGGKVAVAAVKTPTKGEGDEKGTTGSGGGGSLSPRSTLSMYRRISARLFHAGTPRTSTSSGGGGKAPVTMVNGTQLTRVPEQSPPHGSSSPDEGNTVVLLGPSPEPIVDPGHKTGADQGSKAPAPGLLATAVRGAPNQNGGMTAVSQDVSKQAMVDTLADSSVHSVARQSASFTTLAKLPGEGAGGIASAGTTAPPGNSSRAVLQPELQAAQGPVAAHGEGPRSAQSTSIQQQQQQQPQEQQQGGKPQLKRGPSASQTSFMGAWAQRVNSGRLQGSSSSPKAAAANSSSNIFSNAAGGGSSSAGGALMGTPQLATTGITPPLPASASTTPRRATAPVVASGAFAGGASPSGMTAAGMTGSRLMAHQVHHSNSTSALHSTPESPFESGSLQGDTGATLLQLQPTHSNSILPASSALTVATSLAPSVFATNSVSAAAGLDGATSATPSAGVTPGTLTPYSSDPPLGAVTLEAGLGYGGPPYLGASATSTNNVSWPGSRSFRSDAGGAEASAPSGTQPQDGGSIGGSSMSGATAAARGHSGSVSGTSTTVPTPTGATPGKRASPLASLSGLLSGTSDGGQGGGAAATKGGHSRSASGLGRHKPTHSLSSLLKSVLMPDSHSTASAVAAPQQNGDTHNPSEVLMRGDKHSTAVDGRVSKGCEAVHLDVRAGPLSSLEHQYTEHTEVTVNPAGAHQHKVGAASSKSSLSSQAGGAGVQGQAEGNATTGGNPPPRASSLNRTQPSASTTAAGGAPFINPLFNTSASRQGTPTFSQQPPPALQVDLPAGHAAAEPSTSFRSLPNSGAPTPGPLMRPRSASAANVVWNVPHSTASAGTPAAGIAFPPRTAFPAGSAAGGPLGSSAGLLGSSAVGPLLPSSGGASVGPAGTETPAPPALSDPAGALALSPAGSNTSLPLPSLPLLQHPQGGAGGVEGGGSLGGAMQQPLQSLAQVVRMQRVLTQERQEAAALRAQVAELNARLDALARLRRAESRRALVEGARFLMFLPSGAGPLYVHLCFLESERVIRIAAEGKDGLPVLAPGFAASAGGSATELPLHIPLSALSRVELGSSLFPPKEGALTAGLKALLTGRTITAAASTPIIEAKCMTLIPAAPWSRVHLQLPPSGNGRSRDEWATALQDVMAATAATNGVSTTGGGGGSGSGHGIASAFAEKAMAGVGGPAGPAGGSAGGAPAMLHRLSGPGSMKGPGGGVSTLRARIRGATVGP